MNSAIARNISIAAVAFGGSLGTAALVVARWIRHFVNEDQALLWAAASAWGDLSPHEPNFWGQSYGTTLEAIPTEILSRLGIGYQTGLPLSIAAFNLLTWLALAAAAWRRGRLLLAVIAVAAIGLLSPDYVVLAVAYNTAAGRLLVAIAVLIVLWRPRVTWWPSCCALSAAGLAVAFDNSTAVLAVALLIYAVVNLWRDRASRPNPAHTWLGVALAVLPAAAFSLFSRWWYHAHPDDLTHPAPTFQPSLTRLRDNLTNPTRHFSVFEFELWQSPWLPLCLVVGVVAWLIVRRQWLAVTCLGASAAVLAFVLAVPRANDYLPTPYYSAGRVVLVAPMALWFAVAIARMPTTRLASDPPGISPDDSRPLASTLRLLPLIVAVGCALTFAVRIARWDSETARLMSASVEFPNYPLTRAGELHQRCASVSRAVAQEGASFAVFELRTPAYACAGLGVGALTVYPPYERRSWVLDEFLSSTPQPFIYVGTAPTCDSPLVTCRELDAQITLVEPPDDMSPLETLELLGITVRPPFDTFDG